MHFTASLIGISLLAIAASAAAYMLTAIIVGPLIRFWQASFAPTLGDLELHAAARTDHAAPLDRTQPFRAFAARARGHDEWIGDGFDSGASGGHMMLA